MRARNPHSIDGLNNSTPFAALLLAPPSFLFPFVWQAGPPFFIFYLLFGLTPTIFFTMFAQILPLAALLALVDAHGVILAAQGDTGSPPSVGFQVNDAIARNCTTINPCQMDSTIIRDAEIAAGTVNSCGRTKLTGNIDVGEVTENALAANEVTQVQSGSQMQVTIHQVNADGAGPYFCDLDEGSNTGIFSQNLTVTNNIPGANGLSQAQAQDFNITVTMPNNFKCVGGSTGNVCTVRCRNNAQAGAFGGMFMLHHLPCSHWVCGH
jgi:hypothetical protein